MFKYLIFSCIAAAILLSCNDKKELTIKYPNNDSELTLLMRDMYTYHEAIKKDLKSGKNNVSIKEFEKIHTAVSTEPSKSKSDIYQAMSHAYKQAIDSFNDSSQQKKSFNHIVDNCMTCHRQLCPGPMVKIKKLYLTE